MAFGWGATLVLLAIVLIAIAAFWVWWILPNRGHKPTQPDDDDPTESKERLDLLRAARRWGDVSSTSESYLKRQRKRTP